MSAALNVHDAMRAQGNAKELAKWSKANPDQAAIVREVIKLRAEVI